MFVPVNRTLLPSDIRTSSARDPIIKLSRAIRALVSRCWISALVAGSMLLEVRVGGFDRLRRSHERKNRRAWFAAGQFRFGEGSEVFDFAI